MMLVSLGNKVVYSCKLYL